MAEVPKFVGIADHEQSAAHGNLGERAGFLQPACNLSKHRQVEMPGGYVNRGELLSPPLPLPPFEATMLGVRAPAPQAGRWTVLIVSDDGCSDACVRALDDTRRVLDLLGHDRDRMQRVLVALTRLDADVIANQPDLVGLDTSRTANPELRAPFAAATAGTVLVADPLRNVILRYRPGQARWFARTARMDRLRPHAPVTAVWTAFPLRRPARPAGEWRPAKSIPVAGRKASARIRRSRQSLAFRPDHPRTRAAW